MSETQKWIDRADELITQLQRENDALKADASWAATHRSELADLRVAFKKAEQENAALRSDLTAARMLQFSSAGDNHHNANLCPYCQARSGQETK